MLMGLVPAVLALASAAFQGDHLVCEAGFTDGARYGYVQLHVGGDYRPRSLILFFNEPDGWTRAEARLDPADRRLPGQFSHAFFAVRFTESPVFPLTMTAYADGDPRWRSVVHVPFWPTTLGSGPGTVGHVPGADDRLPVPTPRELRIVLIDARGRQVGETRYILPSLEPGGPVATALAAVETHYRARSCRAPPPAID